MNTTATNKANANQNLNRKQTRLDLVELDLVELDLAELTRDFVCDCTVSQRERCFRFEGNESCSIKGDSQLLKCVLQHLFSDVASCSAPGCEVSVTVWDSAKTAILMVVARGTEVAAADTERLFLPFERLDDARSGAKENVSGLFKAQKIVEALGGSIEIQGDEERGMVVKISFPITDPQNHNV